LELTVCFVQTPVDGFSLEGHDLVELLLDVVEDGGEVVAVELLAALLAELLEEVAETFETLAEGVAHAALEEVAEGVLEVAEVQEVIGKTGEDIVGVEGRDILRAVPFGVAEAVGHAAIIRPHPGPAARPSPAWRARVAGALTPDLWSDPLPVGGRGLWCPHPAAARRPAPAWRARVAGALTPPLRGDLLPLGGRGLQVPSPLRCAETLSRLAGEGCRCPHPSAARRPSPAWRARVVVM